LQRTSSIANAERPFPGIDLLRFLCAFAVVCFHYSKVFGGGQHFPAEPFRAELGLLFDSGGFAVPIFWGISGFIFFWKYADALHQHAVTGREFLVLRLSRLYPLHLATLLIVAGLQLAYARTHSGQPFVTHYNDLSHFVLQLLMISYWPAEFSFNAPIWSVSLEVVAYAVFFVCALSLRLNRLRNSAILAAIFALLWAGHALLYFEFANCLMLFFLGGLVHALVRAISAPGLSARGRNWARVLRMYCVFNVLAPLANLAMHNRLAEVYLGGYIDHYCCIVMAPSILFVFCRLRLPEKAGHAAEALGNLTYASYLIHFPLQVLTVLCLDAAGVPRRVIWNDAGFLGFIGVTFVLSHWVYRRFERPAQQLIRQRLLRPAAVRESVKPDAALERMKQQT
jgi:peptidoglycan/LPS O-acetylase OafA/YrhL